MFTIANSILTIADRFAQIVKNLVFLAKTLQILDGKTELRMENRQHAAVAPEGNLSTKKGSCLTLTALLNNMNKIATLEASQTPKHTKKVSTNGATTWPFSGCQFNCKAKTVVIYHARDSRLFQTKNLKCFPQCSGPCVNEGEQWRNGTSKLSLIKFIYLNRTPINLYVDGDNLYCCRVNLSTVYTKSFFR